MHLWACTSDYSAAFTRIRDAVAALPSCATPVFPSFGASDCEALDASEAFWLFLAEAGQVRYP